MLYDRIEWMMPLIQWTNCFRHLVGFKFTSMQAMEWSMEEFFHSMNQEEVKEGIDWEEGTMRKHYESFMTAWNAFRAICPTKRQIIQKNVAKQGTKATIDSVDKKSEDTVTTIVERIVDFDRDIIPECKDISLVALTWQANVIWSCIRKRHEGCQVAYMLHVLGEYQNQFLGDVCQRIEGYTSNSVGSQQHRYDTLKQSLSESLQTRQTLQTLSAKQLISYDHDAFWSEVLTTFACNRYDEHTHQNILEYDLIGMEEYIMHTLFGSSSQCPSFLQTNLLQQTNGIEEFHFQQEVFSKECYNIFQVLHDLLIQLKHRQERMLPIANGDSTKQQQQELMFVLSSELRHCLATDRFVQDEYHVEHDLFPVIENVLYVLQTLLPSWQASLITNTSHELIITNVTQSIYDFVLQYLDKPTLTLFQSYVNAQSLLPSLPIYAIELLYERLEDTLSNTILYSLSESYCQALSSSVAECFQTVILPHLGKDLSGLESTWRRFLLRYLRNTTNTTTNTTTTKGNNANANTNHHLESVKIDPSTPLVHYLTFFRWSDSLDLDQLCEDHPEVSTFFQQVTVGHSYALWKMIYELYELRHGHAVHHHRSHHMHDERTVEQVTSTLTAATSSNSSSSSSSTASANAIITNATATTGRIRMKPLSSFSSTSVTTGTAPNVD